MHYNLIRAMNKANRINEIKITVQNLNADTNLHFIYFEKDLQNAFKKIDTNEKFEIALKKGLLYSEKTIIVTNEITAHKNFGDGVDNPKDDFNNFFTRSKISQTIEDLGNKYQKVADFHDKFYFIPEKLTSKDRYTDSFYNVEESENILFDFSNEYINDLGLRVSLNNPNIKNHIFENYCTEETKLGVLNLWLPQLKNIPLELMLKLRKDEENTFKIYQYELKRILNNFESNDPENKLLELFQNVDENVRKLENRLKIIKKSSILSKTDAVIGTTVVGLTFFLPEEIYRMIIAILGSYNLYKFKDTLFKQKEKMNDFRTSEFYIPWLLNKKSIK